MKCVELTVFDSYERQIENALIELTKKYPLSGLVRVTGSPSKWIQECSLAHFRFVSCDNQFVIQEDWILHKGDLGDI